MTIQKLTIACIQFFCCLVICSCARQQVLPPLPVQGAPGEKLFQRAEMKFQSQEYVDAIHLYQDYINIYPGSPLVPSAFMKIGAIYLVQNQYSEARRIYQKMIETTPENQFIPDAMLGILTTYYHEGDYEKLLNQAEKLDDHSIPIEIYKRKHALQGDVYHTTGLPLQSVESYLKVYMTTDDEEEKKNIRTRLENAAAGLSIEEMQELIPKIEELNLKGNFEYLLGLQYAQSDRYEDAVRQLTQFTITYPDHKYVEDAHLFMNNLVKISEYDRTAVGCLLPLTGRYKTFGSRALKGIELALMQFSILFPQADIRLVIRDTQGNPDRASTIVNELAEQKVAALIGPIITANAAAKEAQSHQIPIITMTQKEGIADIGDYVFRNFLTPEMQMKTMISFAVEHLGLQKFAILYPKEKYGTTYMNLFWDQVIAHGGEIRGAESYESGQADFASPIKKLVGLYYDIPQELKPEVEPDFSQNEILTDKTLTKTPDEPQAIVDFDAIFIPDGPETAGLILPQLTYYDATDIYLLGTNLWHSDKLVQMAQQHVQGAIMPEIFFAESSNETVIEFVHNFTETYGEKPGFIEAIAYDTAFLLFQTIGSQDLQFRNSIKNRLLNLYDFQGVTGKTSFSQNGDANKELFMLQINGFKFTELEYE
jgi:branched-chain amino acid transport system substrate-binding protein